ncbi:hypothetical protein I5M32_12875 [Pedobacter sp. SD-b]|uniref:Tetratricopeptide repeat-containing protein n=1 Tax=Pedobacter segetis TaxID=2793069 RepID=A0ABS1BLS7_9SPHI|nr:hypothetical protein [Pedobacter segetis]MBK0383854.1 hypothetical protein [Pedobacter segetis]
MKNKAHLLLSFIVLSSQLSLAQTPYERLGQKAMTVGNFTNAASYFEKAYDNDHANMNALWLMGYSSYHAADYNKSIAAFDKLIAMKPTETAAYYYRGKAKVLQSSSITDYASKEHEALLLGAIKDFSTAIDLTPEDMKLYQNRGLANQEYAIYKTQKVQGVYNKLVALKYLKTSISDFEKVASTNGERRDITALIQKSKDLINDLN